MTNKKRISGLVFALLTVLFAVTAVAPAFKFKHNSAAAAGAEPTDNLKIAVLSDTHYFPASMTGNNAAYELELNSGTNMITESESILDTALGLIRNDNPDVLLITGDLTKDGEYAAHQEVAGKLAAFKSELTGVEVYVINGNHDINNLNAFDYSSGEAVAAQRTTPADFKTIYGAFGYNQAVSKYQPAGDVAGTLSYAVRPANGYTILAVDTNKYTSDVTSSGENIQETGGTITDGLLDWIKAQTFAARGRGDAVLVFQHHGVVPHFAGQPALFGDYLVDNYADIMVTYADMEIGYVFTGHMHANDISKHTTQKGNTIYDIETGSAVTYPSPYRICEFSRVREGANKLTNVNADITTKYINNITFTDLEGNPQTITNLQNYGRAKAEITNDVAFNMLSYSMGGNISAGLTSAIGEGGIAGMINSLIAENVYVLQIALGAPLDPEDGIGSLVRAALEKYLGEEIREYKIPSKELFGDQLKGTPLEPYIPEYIIIEYHYDVENARVVIDPLSNTINSLSNQNRQTLELLLFFVDSSIERMIERYKFYLNADDLTDTVYDVLAQIDALIADPEFVDPVAASAIADFMAVEIVLDSQVFTMGELINELYHGHLYGDEQPSRHMQEFIAMFNTKAGINFIIYQALTPILANVLDQVFENVTVDFYQIVDGDMMILLEDWDLNVTIAELMAFGGLNTQELLESALPVLLDTLPLIAGMDVAGMIEDMIVAGLSMAYDLAPADNNVSLTQVQSDLILTITFKAEDFDDIIKNVYYGETLTDIPSVPTKTGHVGVWDVTDFTNIQSDLIVNAVYTANTITITFKISGKDDIIRTVPYGGTLTDIPDVPTRKGYKGEWDVTDFNQLEEDVVVNALYTKDGSDEDCKGCTCGAIDLTGGTFLFTGLLVLAGACFMLKRRKVKDQE